jgi:hypothetical protein
MKLTVDDAVGGPTSASERRVLSEESRGRNVRPNKECTQIPMPMMLIFSALANASRD